MIVSRRSFLKTSALAGGLSTAGLVVFPSRRALAAPLADPFGTTLDRTLVRGAPGAGGYQLIVPGPGEPHLVRQDIGGIASPGRFGRRRPLVAFSQFSDIHMLDAESPARVEFLDRFGDPGSPVAAEVANLDGSYRPQEILTVQVADAMVRAVNRQAGARPLARRSPLPSAPGITSTTPSTTRRGGQSTCSTASPSGRVPGIRRSTRA